MWLKLQRKFLKRSLQQSEKSRISWHSVRILTLSVGNGIESRFVLTLGDIIDGNDTVERTSADFDIVLTSLSMVCIETKHNFIWFSKHLPFVSIFLLLESFMTNWLATYTLISYLEVNEILFLKQFCEFFCLVQLELPTYHLLGNHCLTLPREQMLQNLQMPDRFYHAELHPGWALVSSLFHL
jgi:hypothetical protein